ncbi:SOS response-associated peptidase [Salinicola aestuarinus]|uniref:SOS response-associated peptidase n=1 Tax=Salinicola aestuarinus TaxID=1949082 RepID=UPI000DA1C4EE|nr:SOS response-associated peptidase [Salinicola aestuarinus]
MPGRLHIDDWTRYSALPRFERDEVPTFSPNVPPRTWLTLLRHESGRVLLRDAFWGLTPSWLKVLDHAPHLARAESLDDRRMFRDALATRRCVVPVTGVYVWQQRVRGKQPYMVTHTDRAPLLLAGLWTRYTLDAGPSRDSCALITVAASPFIAPLSERFPSLIAPEQLERWLDPATPLADVRSMITSAPDSLLGAFPVSKAINSPAEQAWASAYPVGAMQVCPSDG